MSGNQEQFHESLQPIGAFDRLPDVYDAYMQIVANDVSEHEYRHLTISDEEFDRLFSDTEVIKEIHQALVERADPLPEKTGDYFYLRDRDNTLGDEQKMMQLTEHVVAGIVRYDQICHIVEFSARDANGCVSYRGESVPQAIAEHPIARGELNSSLQNRSIFRSGLLLGDSVILEQILECDERKPTEFVPEDEMTSFDNMHRAFLTLG